MHELPADAHRLVEHRPRALLNVFFLALRCPHKDLEEVETVPRITLHVRDRARVITVTSSVDSDNTATTVTVETQGVQLAKRE